MKDSTPRPRDLDLTRLVSQIGKLSKQIAELKEVIRKSQVKELPDVIMNSDEAAEYLRISRKQLDLIKQKREIPFHKRAKCIWYRKSDIDEWLRSFRVSF